LFFVLAILAIQLIIEIPRTTTTTKNKNNNSNN
jgi:hypothetical protein